MAGPKSNVIEYVFQGNTLDLQQAIKQVSSLLNTSAKKFREFQKDGPTAQQDQQLKAARKLLKQLRAAAKEEATLSDERRKRTRYAGKAALSQAANLAKQAAQVQIRHEKQVQAEKEKTARLTSTAGQEMARQNAAFLEHYSARYGEYLSEEGYDEIQKALQAYKATLEDTTVGVKDKAEATRRLNEVYKDYSGTLRKVQNASEAAARGIGSFADLQIEVTHQLNQSVKSLSFWVQLLRMVVNFLSKGVEASADYTESINYMRAVTGEYREELEEFIKIQEAAFGLSPTELRNSVAMFYQYGESMGWTGEQAAELAESATKLAQDLASLQNIDLDEAAQKLRSGLAGETRALARWGISVHESNIEQWLLSKGIDKSLNSMNEASQAAARYAYILESTTEAQGDLSRTLKSPANQFRILKTQTTLFAQNLGTLVIPMLTLFARVINGVLMPLNAFMQAFTSGTTDNITESTKETTDALEDMEKASSEAAVGLTSLDEINQDSESTASMGVDADIADLVADLNSLYDNGSEGAKNLTAVFQDLGEALAPVWELLADPPIEFDGFLSGVATHLEYLLTPLEDIADWLDTAPDWLKDIIGGFLQLTTAVLGTAAAITIFKTLTGSGAFKTFIKVLSGMWTGFGSLTKSILTNTAAFLKNTAAVIKNTIANWWNNASLAAKITLVSFGAAAGVAAVALGIAASVGAFSSKTGENEAASVDTPALAKGGVVKAPTLALVGEGDYNEAVVPLGNSPQFKAMKKDIAEQTAQTVSRGPVRSLGSSGSYGSMGGSGRPIILQLNGREVARTLLPDLAYVQNQVGVTLK